MPSIAKWRITGMMSWLKSQDQYTIMFDPHCNLGMGAFICVDRSTQSVMFDGEEFNLHVKALEKLYRHAGRIVRGDDDDK